MLSILYWAAALGAAVSQPARISPASPPVPEIEPRPAVADEAQEALQPATLPPIRLSRETPVKVVIDQSMSSDRVSSGYHFPIYLAEPVVLEGRTVLPAGIRGEGEVIDAKKSSGGGAGGGIVTNARFLMCGSTRVALGKMHLSASGHNGYAAAIGTTAVVGVFGLLVRGHNAQIQQGTLADAKIIADVDVPASC